MYFDIEEFEKEYPNYFIYCIIGSRGCGKSYSLKRKMIKDFLRDGSQSLVFRRYVEQAKEMKDTYFNDIIEKEFSSYEFELKGNIMYIDKEPFCIFKGLNGNGLTRGNSFPKIKNLVYEECQPEQTEKLIKGEYQRIESSLFTIDRGENRVTLYMLGNNTCYYNPIFDTLKLYPSPKPNGIRKNDLMIIKTLDSPKEFKDYMRKSNIGKLSIMSGTYDYNIENKNITNDTFNVVNKKDLWDTNKLKPVFQCRVDNNKVIKIWKCEGGEQNYYYIDNNQKANVKEYFYDSEYQKTGNKHISLLGLYDSHYLVLYNKLGCVFFNTAETKYYFEMMIKFLRR